MVTTSRKPLSKLDLISLFNVKITCPHSQPCCSHLLLHHYYYISTYMLAHIAGVMDAEFFFKERCIKFIKMALVSENCAVCTISNMGRYGSHSIMGANFKHLNRKYCLDESNVYSKWKHVCSNNEELIRISMQVKELINMRDRCMNGIFKREECNDIIEFRCIDWRFSFYYGSKCAILFWISAV